MIRRFFFHDPIRRPAWQSSVRRRPQCRTCDVGADGPAYPCAAGLVFATGGRRPRGKGRLKWLRLKGR